MPASIRIPAHEAGSGRVLFDVSTTARMPTTRTGIQRTVRSLCRALTRDAANYPMPVLPVRVEPAEREIWELRASPRFPDDPSTLGPLAIRSGDILLMLDSTWDLYGAFARSVFPIVRERCGRVITGVYDILPVTNPQFFTKRAASMFNTWFQEALMESDMLVAISNATRSEVERYNFTALPIEVIHLGADFLPMRQADQTPAHDGPSSQTMYLMVGTIEPRKGHAIVLDAFEELWRNGSQARLVVVGVEGWKVGSLMRRMRRLARAEPRFDYFTGISDNDLSELYKQATALVAASVAEGFGLPLIEAKMRGKRVIASDIPPFLEIGDSETIYFSAGNARALAATVAAFERQKDAMCLPRVANWLSWNESADALMEKITEKILRTHHEDPRYPDAL